MKIIIQRVAQAAVRVDGSLVSEIKQGYLLLVGFRKGDDAASFPFMIRKF